MTPHPTPQQVFKTWYPVCFCGEKRAALPPEPLEKHSFGCLNWDWAMAVKLITPAQRNTQLDEYAKTIGDTDASSPETDT